MHVAAAAYPLDWHNRWNGYVGKLRVWTRSAADTGATVLVFPEFAAVEIASLAGDENAREPARVIEALAARQKDVDGLHDSLAREFGVHILAASGPFRGPEGRIVNRARFFTPDGRRGAQNRLEPPADGLWGISPGAGPAVFETALGRVGVLIGADLLTPGPAAAMAMAGAIVLLAPACPADAEDAALLLEAAEARARETGAVVALAVALNDGTQAPALGPLTGTAAIFGPEGAAASGKAGQPGWVQAEVEPAARPVDAAPAALTELELAREG